MLGNLCLSTFALRATVDTILRPGARQSASAPMRYGGQAVARQPKVGAGGQTRTADPALMRRVL